MPSSSEGASPREGPAKGGGAEGSERRRRRRRRRRERREKAAAEGEGQAAPPPAEGDPGPEELEEDPADREEHGQHAAGQAVVRALLTAGEDRQQAQPQADNTERNLGFLQYSKRKRFRTDPSALLSEPGEMQAIARLIIKHLRVATRSKEFTCQLIKRFISGTKRVQAFYRSYRIQRQRSERRMLATWRLGEEDARRRIAHQIEIRRVGKRSAQCEREMLALMCLYHDCWAPLPLKLQTLEAMRRKRRDTFRRRFAKWREFKVETHRALQQLAGDTAVTLDAIGGEQAAMAAGVHGTLRQFELLSRYTGLWLCPVYDFSGHRVTLGQCVAACCRLLTAAGEGAAQEQHGKRNAEYPAPAPRRGGSPRKGGPGLQPGSAARRWAAYYGALVRFNLKDLPQLIQLFRPTPHAGRGAEGHVWRMRPRLLQTDVQPRRAVEAPPARKAPSGTPRRPPQPASLAGAKTARARPPSVLVAGRHAATPPPCPGKPRERPPQHDLDQALREVLEFCDALAAVRSHRPAQYAEQSVGSPTPCDLLPRQPAVGCFTPHPRDISRGSSSPAPHPKRPSGHVLLPQPPPPPSRRPPSRPCSAPPRRRTAGPGPGSPSSPVPPPPPGPAPRPPARQQAGAAPCLSSAVSVSPCRLSPMPRLMARPRGVRRSTLPRAGGAEVLLWRRLQMASRDVAV